MHLQAHTHTHRVRFSSPGNASKHGGGVIASERTSTPCHSRNVTHEGRCLQHSLRLASGKVIRREEGIEVIEFIQCNANTSHAKVVATAQHQSAQARPSATCHALQQVSQASQAPTPADTQARKRAQPCSPTHLRERLVHRHRARGIGHSVEAQKSAVDGLWGGAPCETKRGPRHRRQTPEGCAAVRW